MKQLVTTEWLEKNIDQVKVLDATWCLPNSNRNAEEEFNQHSLYLYTGIWSHFIHPDDVYQVPSDKNTSHGSYAYRNTKRLGWRTSKNGELGFLPLFKNYLEK